MGKRREPGQGGAAPCKSVRERTAGALALSRPRLREGLDMELGDLVVDELRVVVAVEGLGDVGDGAEVLEPGHLVDDADDVGSVSALAFAEMDGIHRQVAGPPVRTGLRHAPRFTAVGRILRRARPPRRRRFLKL